MNPVSLWESLQRRARDLKRETVALYLAARHPRTPWYAKLWVAAVVAYAFSPIDLIPDFVPILGHLDELVLLPLGLAVAIRMVPPEVLAECRERAGEVLAQGKPVSRGAALAVVGVWLLLAGLALLWGCRAIQGR